MTILRYERDALRARLETLEGEALALEHTNDELVALNKALRARVEAAEAVAAMMIRPHQVITDLRAALAQYGGHLVGCAGSDVRAQLGLAQQECDCGWAERARALLEQKP